MEHKEDCKLSRREFQVLHCNHLSDGETAEKLFISPHTVKTHQRNIAKRYYFIEHTELHPRKDVLGYEIIKKVELKPKPEYTNGQLKLDLDFDV